MVVYPCPGVKAVQYRKRGGDQVQISLRVADGGEVRTRRVTVNIQKTVETVVRG